MLFIVRTRVVLLKFELPTPNIKRVLSLQRGWKFGLLVPYHCKTSLQIFFLLVSAARTDLMFKFGCIIHHGWDPHVLQRLYSHLLHRPDLFVGDSMLVILQDTIKSTQSPKYRIEQKDHTYPLCIRTISFLRLPNSFFNSRLDASSSFNSTVLPVEACESQPVALVTSLYRLRPVNMPCPVRCVSLGNV